MIRLKPRNRRSSSILLSDSRYARGIRCGLPRWAPRAGPGSSAADGARNGPLACSLDYLGAGSASVRTQALEDVGEARCARWARWPRDHVSLVGARAQEVVVVD